jgi:EAL domain-containing protein (putative c-di-GMP-specific phosphodiesterase class I)
LTEALRLPHQIGVTQVLATAAIGVSLFPEDGEDIDTLRANADRAMYSAKSAGGNRFESFSAELAERARERLELQRNLGEALHKGELVLFYQPQFDLKTNRITALEALLRWRHPQRGLLRPDQFLQMAEDSGLILPIDAWALETACREIRRFSDAGCGGIRIAVNVSGRQFVCPGFEDQVRRAVEECGIKPGLLELELTEDLIMEDFGRSHQKIENLRRLGVRVSIDDFGAGKCSLSIIRRLTLDQWKIDRSFIQDLGGGQKDTQLVESIIRLARGMGVSAVAEGVESIPQLRALRAAGCEQAQGFLLGMPRPAAEIARLILHLPPLGALRARPIMPAAQNPMWLDTESPEPVCSAPVLAKGSLAGFLTVGN